MFIHLVWCIHGNLRNENYKNRLVPVAWNNDKAIQARQPKLYLIECVFIGLWAKYKEKKVKREESKKVSGKGCENIFTRRKAESNNKLFYTTYLDKKTKNYSRIINDLQIIRLKQ